MPVDKLEKTRKANVCAECGEWLNIFLQDGETFVACKDYFRTHHTRIMRQGKYQELNIESRREQMAKELGTEKTLALEKYSYGALANQEQAMTVLNTIWPRAPQQEKIKAAMLCVQYQLNPLMKHIYLIPFKTKSGGESWATVLGIQASRLIAHRAGNFSYVDNTPRIMTKEEQETIFGEVFSDRLWAITRLRDKDGNEASGYGCYMKSDNPLGVDKGNTRANMAFIRSERQAMDRLYAGRMPEQSIEVVDERFVDTDTGEIVESSATELPPEPILEPEPPPEQVQQAPEPVQLDPPEEVAKEEAGKTKRPTRDPETVVKKQDLLDALTADFGMKPAEITKELTAAFPDGLPGTFGECYAKIVELRCGK